MKRYSRGTFQKANSLNHWSHQQANTRDKYRHRRNSNSLKLKIIQHCKELSLNSPDSPDDIFRTPNTTLDADDSALESFSTPIGDFSHMKMKSMNNLLDAIALQNKSLSRMKSMSELEKEHGDTPVDLVKLKRDFETKRFNNAKMQSLSNLTNGEDDIDGFMNQRHHSDNGPSPETFRHSLQPSKTRKRVGNTKYIGADSVDDGNYQLMKIQSMGTINDIANGHMRTSKSFDPFLNVDKGVGKKYDKTYVVPIRLDERFLKANGNNCDRNDDVFKVPVKPGLALRKEKSSSCIDGMKNRGTSLYDRLR